MKIPTWGEPPSHEDHRHINRIARELGALFRGSGLICTLCTLAGVRASTIRTHLAPEASWAEALKHASRGGALSRLLEVCVEAAPTEGAREGLIKIIEEG